MGATPYDGGVTFRVWAPNADAVYARGEFNGWSLSNPLALEGASGMWSLDVPGVSIGDEYKFYIENTTPSDSGATTVWRRDPYSRSVVSLGLTSGSNSVVYDPDAWSWSGPHSPPAHPPEELIIYEMHVGSFNPPNGTPGTFNDAINRLDYLTDLGITAVQLMPLTPAHLPNGWDYDPEQYYAVRREYGGADGLKAFVQACHDRGLAVLIDVVYNHSGAAGDMVDFDLWFEEEGGGIWYYNDADRGFTPWGPRPNYSRPEVRDFFKNNVRLLMDEFRVDGFRFDATGAMRKTMAGDPIPDAVSLLQEINLLIETEFPHGIRIAEDFGGDNLATLPAESGGLGFQSEWIGPAGNIARVFTQTDAERDLNDLRQGMEFTPNGDFFNRVIYSESHDTAATDFPEFTFPFRGAYLPRRINRVDPDTNLDTRKLSMLASVITLTIPGIPMLFMGQETYATSVFEFPNPPALDWNTLLQDHQGIVNLHRDLITLRLNKTGTTRGLLGRGFNIYHLNEENNTMAWHRFDAGGEGDDVVVLANFSATDFSMGYQFGVPAGGTWHVRFNSDEKQYDSEFGTDTGALTEINAEEVPHDSLPFQITLPYLRPYTALILSQDAATSSGTTWSLY
jgi:1,4-alpha-glucan branching enzyme